MISRRVASSLPRAGALVLTLLLAQVCAAGSAGDRYLFGEGVDLRHPIAGSLQVYGADAVIREAVAGDVLVVGGNVRVRDHGRVLGDVICLGGMVDAPAHSIGGRTYAPGMVEGTVAMLGHGAAQPRGAFALLAAAAKLALLILWLLAGIVLTAFLGRDLRVSSVEVRASALHCFAVGLVALTSFVLTAIVFSYLVVYAVGVPLLAALGMFAVAAKVYGMVAVFHAAGSILAGSRSREELGRRRWIRGDMAMVVIGAVVLGIIRMIPLVGAIVWGSASIFAVGVSLATRFGRRQPWFLAWHAAEA